MKRRASPQARITLLAVGALFVFLIVLSHPLVVLAQNLNPCENRHGWVHDPPGHTRALSARIEPGGLAAWATVRDAPRTEIQ